MSNDTLICADILANFFSDADIDCNYWYVVPERKMVVVAEESDTDCTLYEDAKACCIAEVIPSIAEWWEDSDVTRTFTPEQVRWMAQHSDSEWLRDLAGIN